MFGRKDKKDELAGTAAHTDPQPTPAYQAAGHQDGAAAEKKPPADENEEQPSATTEADAKPEMVYPKGLKLACILASLYISLFLVSLDRLIVSTAIPQITDDFHSVTDIGWYGSAFLLTNAAFQLLYGKIYTFFNIKLVFMTAIALFEAGSAICGAAPSSAAFIVGRAVAGCGSAGIMAGTFVVLVYSVPLRRRPLYQGAFGAVFGVSAVVGPLLGGAFTSKVSWRWCFYVNLPVGGLALPFLFFLLDIPPRAEAARPLREKLAQLDVLGTAMFMPGVICLLLALQWGGSKYPWHEGRIVALLVLASVLLVGFVLVQVLRPATATVPPRIFRQRSILAGVWATLCTGSQMMIFVYFLPIWFQAVKGVDPIDSGVRLIPMLLSMVVASLCTGVLVSRVGYYNPPMLVGTCVLAVGAGMLTTLRVDSAAGAWVGYQVLYGLGMGCTLQAPNMAAQTVLPARDVPVGGSLMFFGQLLGGAVFTSVGQNVFNAQLIARLGGLPGFDPASLQTAGATSVVADVPPELRPAVLVGYNESLRRVFRVGLIVACLVIFGSLGLEWRSVKKGRKEGGAGADDGAKAEEGRAKVGGKDGEQTDVEESKTGEESTVVGDEKSSHGDVEAGPRAGEKA